MNQQSDTKEGIVTFPSNSSLSGKNGYLAKLVNSAGTAKCDIAAAVTDSAVFAIEDGKDASGDVCSLRPLHPNRSFRLKVKAGGTGGVTGDLVQLQNDGTIDIDSGAGARVVIGIAEETFVAGQLAKIRPMVMKYLS
jgi:hypothetical protein